MAHDRREMFGVAESRVMDPMVRRQAKADQFRHQIYGISALALANQS